ncbi:response regulator [Leptolyngbya sp. AN03gr2]|uniref:response regulator n=1 Tax=unclassified Leptolyngbya TaxID=2650499 RepID=UPI003D3147B5
MDTPSILLVEDNPKDVILIHRAFRKAQITAPVQAVNDGEKAIAYLSGESPYDDRAQYPLPALILLDLKLPRRSGTEVLAWLRQQPGLKRIPVVIFTTSREEIDVNQSYDLGVNAYMVKPVNFDHLVSILETLNVHWLMLNEKPQIVL